jgi:hypothetical protein
MWLAESFRACYGRASLATTQALATGRQIVALPPELRELRVPYYRLYCINSAGGFFRCEDFNADTDEQAIELADELRGNGAAELWQQTRKVHFFKVDQVKQRG